MIQFLQPTTLYDTLEKSYEDKTRRRQDDKTHYQSYPLASKSSVHPDLRIIVVVYNRPHSLERLLNSLNEANYFKDKVQLDVWIDRSKKRKHSLWNLLHSQPVQVPTRGIQGLFCYIGLHVTTHLKISQSNRAVSNLMKGGKIQVLHVAKDH